MNRLSISVCALSLLALAGCSNSAEEAAETNVAESFASRINGAPEQIEQPPSGSEPTEPPAAAFPQARDGIASPYAPGTENAPPGTVCGANLIAEFIGQTADVAARSQIVASVSSANEVRFIPPGAGAITPDAASSRLNVMIDSSGVISGAQCG